MLRMLGMLLGTWMLCASGAQATVIARAQALGGTQSLGAAFDVELRASMSEPVLGWGLDLTYDASKIQLTSAPVIAPAWVAFPAPDGDGLAGAALAAVTGADVLLATLHFQAIGVGVSQLLLSATLSDLTEGFALDPSGFDSVSFESGSVTIVPEPASGALLLAGLVALARRRR